MRRDLKSRTSQPAPKHSRGGTLIGMFIGLVLGVAIAAGVVWYMNKSPVPFLNKGQPAPRNDAPPAALTGPAGKPAQAPQPVALPGKPGDPVPEKRFQFYDILPGKADAVPNKPAAENPKAAAESKDGKKEEARKDEGKESKQPLFLQAGSFGQAQDADNLKANLALMGVEATVQQVMVQDKTFYRVRLGPYQRIEEINKLRADLARAGIDAALVKKE